MPVGKIDRTAWANLIADLVQTETRGKKAPFARLVGVDARTLDRWLHSEVDVREESVRAVARHLNRSPLEMLIAVGYYTRGDLEAIAAGAFGGRPVDEVLELVRTDPRLPDETKNLIIRLILDRRAAEMEQAKRWIEQFAPPKDH